MIVEQLMNLPATRSSQRSALGREFRCDCSAWRSVALADDFVLLGGLRPKQSVTNGRSG
jgi:hypothetical protein